MKLINLIGKNLICKIRMDQKKLTDLIKKMMQLKRNINPGKIKSKIISCFILFLFIFFEPTISQSNIIEPKFVEIKILEKVSSKNSKLILKIVEEKQYGNLAIKTLKCKNSEFDDNPEVTAYIQVRDLTIKDNDKVFLFNGWSFSSSPSIRPFDHPVYDIWLSKCY